jgi:cytochrome P450 family 109
MSDATIVADFDPLSAHFEQHPYEELKRMREHGRAWRHRGTLMPVVSFFHDKDVREMVLDYKTWSSQRTPEYNAKALGDAAILIGNDPPIHTQYRAGVASLFMPGQMLPLAPMVEREVAATLDECVGKGEINFVEDFAANATVRVICNIVGIPAKDRARMRQMTIDIAKEDGRPVFWKQNHQQVIDRIGRVMREMTEYLNEHIARVRAQPKDDILSKLTAMLDNPRHLVGMSILIIGAGNETTTNLLAHGLQELIRHPEQMALLRAQPDLVDGAVEEMLRFRGTIRKQDRISMIDTVIDGVDIHKGDSIALWNASASRDPAAIDRPEVFDITRKPNRHSAFGAGAHMCIGNALARVEMRIAFRQLLQRTRHIEETRGADSYQSLGNGVLEAAERYSVQLVPA